MSLADLEKYLHETENLLCELKAKYSDENERIKNLELLLASINKVLQEKRAGSFIKNEKFRRLAFGLLMLGCFTWIIYYLMVSRIEIDDHGTPDYDPNRRIKSVTYHADFWGDRVRYEYYE